MSFTFPTITIQSAVFTATRIGQTPTISYVNGGTAGSEVVTMDSNFNISIQIQSGVSTNTQIVAAFNATKGTALNGLAAGDICVASTSSGGTTPTCFTAVPLAGGVAVATAFLTVGPMIVTAVSSGTGGNSIRLRFTAGGTAGSEVVTVSTNDISVQIQDGVSSFGQIKDAIAASGPAAALVVCSSNGRSLYAAPSYTALDSPTPNSQKAAHVADLSSYTNLAGGLAAAAATTGAVNGVTVAANATGPTANGVRVTLKPGGTAGSEVVTHDTSGNFFVQIQSGTSTPTQVAAALNADSTFSALYTASHSGSTGMQAVYQDALSAGSGLSAPGSYGFYADQTTVTLTTSYQYLPFGNVMGEVIFVNDESAAGKNLSFSWDGVNVHGIVYPAGNASFDMTNKSGVYVKYTVASPAFHIMAVAR